MEILGNGKQKKSYISVQDCVEGMLFVFKNSNAQVNIFNLSSDDSISVNEIAKTVCKEIGVEGVKFKYTGGERGWKGDVPRVLLDIKKINKLGWQAKYSSKQAIKLSIKQILKKV